MNRRWIITLVASAMVAVLAGCSNGSGGETVRLDLKTNAMAFDQKEITVAKGQRVEMVLANSDTVEHDFSIKKIPVKVETKQHATHGAPKTDLHLHADPLATETVIFTATKEGTYEFYCAVAGHKEAGMIGTLIVN
jgi:uncharacterized cupredoxin-like copper-binding protein